MKCARFVPDSLMGRRLDNNYRNLFLKQSPETLARAYQGEHALNFAEPEFAGKYLDICAAFARSTGTPEPLDSAAQVVESIVAHQRADGYLGGLEKGNEYEAFSVWNQAFTCFGLISYWKQSGDARALNAAMRCMDGVMEGFMREGGPMLLRSGNSGSQHLVILLPAVRLYKATSEERYRRFCEWILETCEQSPTHNILSNPYPLGFGSRKAIETLVFLLGVCEYGEASGDERCMAAAKTYWQETAATHIDPVGSGSIAEEWGYFQNVPAMRPRDLKPNENCVGVGWMELSVLLYNATFDGKYFDAFERTLYNQLFGSQAPDGRDFAYYQGNYGKKAIATAAGMYSCCRFRGMSMMAHMPECAAFVRDNALALPLYASYDQTVQVCDTEVAVEMRTAYPADGKIHIRLKPAKPVQMKLLLRVPAWCKRFELIRNGETQQAEAACGHIMLEDEFSETNLTLTLDLPLRRTHAIVDDLPCMQWEYGPLLLAIDSRWGTPIHSTTLDADSEPQRVSPAVDIGPHAVAFDAPGTVRGTSRLVRLVDYASAGMNNPSTDRFRTWIPETGADMTAIY